MAAREFHGIIYNGWNMPLYWLDDECDSGEWQDPWYPSRVPGAGKIEPQQSGEWRSESGGDIPIIGNIATGTSGWARWSVKVSDSSEEDHFEYAQVNWSVPYNQIFSKIDVTSAVFRNNPDEQDAFAGHDPRPSILELVGIRRAEDGGDPLPTGQTTGETIVDQFGNLVFHWVGAFGNLHLVNRPVVPFILRRRQIAESQKTAQSVQTKEIIYPITSGGELAWYDHLGWTDGSFKWESPKTVGTGWGEFKEVFSGGNGVIYAIMPSDKKVTLASTAGITSEHAGKLALSAATLAAGSTTPPVQHDSPPAPHGPPTLHGGDLVWFRHLGQADGSFKWEGPKTVGTGWGEFKEVFSGTD